VNNPAWYVSALLALLSVAHALDRRLGEGRSGRMLCLASALCLAFLLGAYGTIHVHGVARRIVPRGVIRGAVGFGVGVAAHGHRRVLRGRLSEKSA